MESHSTRCAIASRLVMVSGSVVGDKGEEGITYSIAAYLSNRPPAYARLLHAAPQDNSYTSAADSRASAVTLSSHTNRPTPAHPDHERPPSRAARRESRSDPPRTGVRWSATSARRQCSMFF